MIKCKTTDYAAVCPVNCFYERRVARVPAPVPPPHVHNHRFRAISLGFKLGDYHHMFDFTFELQSHRELQGSLLLISTVGHSDRIKSQGKAWDEGGGRHREGTLARTRRSRCTHSFGGETTTGRLIMQYASENIILCTVELGGKSPNIFFADVADADD